MTARRSTWLQGPPSSRAQSIRRLRIDVEITRTAVMGAVHCTPTLRCKDVYAFTKGSVRKVERNATSHDGRAGGIRTERTCCCRWCSGWSRAAVHSSLCSPPRPGVCRSRRLREHVTDVESRSPNAPASATWLRHDREPAGQPGADLGRSGRVGARLASDSTVRSHALGGVVLLGGFHSGRDLGGRDASPRRAG